MFQYHVSSKKGGVVKSYGIYSIERFNDSEFIVTRWGHNVLDESFSGRIKAYNALVSFVESTLGKNLSIFEMRD